MTKRPTALERAFELANSGELENTNQVKHRLKREGFDHHQVEGPRLVSEITRLCKLARQSASAGADGA